MRERARVFLCVCVLCVTKNHNSFFLSLRDNITSACVFLHRSVRNNQLEVAQGLRVKPIPIFRVIHFFENRSESNGFSPNF